MVISGIGDIQIDVLRSKLKSRFGADTTVSTPVVAYREKIKKKVKVEGKHKAVGRTRTVRPCMDRV